MINFEKFGPIGIAASIIAIGYSIYTQRKLNGILTTIDLSIDEVSKGITVDISDAMIEKAINKVVDREVVKVIKTVSNEVLRTIRSDIHKEVKVSVNDSYQNIKTSVTKEVSEQVANMDMRRLKEEVKEKAKDLVIEKFDGNLESLLADFNNSLSNVSKIYNSIADSMVKKKESEAVFKIGLN